MPGGSRKRKCHEPELADSPNVCTKTDKRLDKPTHEPQASADLIDRRLGWKQGYPSVSGLEEILNYRFHNPQIALDILNLSKEGREAPAYLLAYTGDRRQKLVIAEDRELAQASRYYANVEEDICFKNSRLEEIYFEQNFDHLVQKDVHVTTTRGYRQHQRATIIESGFAGVYEDTDIHNGPIAAEKAMRGVMAHIGAYPRLNTIPFTTKCPGYNKNFAASKYPPVEASKAYQRQVLRSTPGTVWRWGSSDIATVEVVEEGREQENFTSQRSSPRTPRSQHSKLAASMGSNDPSSHKTVTPSETFTNDTEEASKRIASSQFPVLAYIPESEAEDSTAESRTKCSSASRSILSNTSATSTSPSSVQPLSPPASTDGSTSPLMMAVPIFLLGEQYSRDVGAVRTGTPSLEHASLFSWTISSLSTRQGMSSKACHRRARSC